MPDDRITGGKVVRRGTKRVENRRGLTYGRQQFVAQLGVSGSQVQSFAGPTGASKDTTAMAHMLAQLVYRMLRYGEQYIDKGTISFVDRQKVSGHLMN